MGEEANPIPFRRMCAALEVLIFCMHITTTHAKCIIGTKPPKKEKVTSYCLLQHNKQQQDRPRALPPVPSTCDLATLALSLSLSLCQRPLQNAPPLPTITINRELETCDAEPHINFPNTTSIVTMAKLPNSTNRSTSPLQFADDDSGSTEFLFVCIHWHADK